MSWTKGFTRTVVRVMYRREVTRPVASRDDWVFNHVRDKGSFIDPRYMTLVTGLLSSLVLPTCHEINKPPGKLPLLRAW